MRGSESAGLAGRLSQLRYAPLGEDRLAFREVTGAGSHEVILTMGGTIPMESLFEDAVASRLVEGLADLGRLVLFDRRGVGLSDPPADWGDPLGRWVEDLEAVIDAAQLTEPVLVAGRVSAPAAILFAERHDDLTALILFEPSGPAIDEERVRAQLSGDADSVEMWCPSRADEPGFREWFARAGQAGASPRIAVHTYPFQDEAGISALEAAAARVRVPTLVLRRPSHPLSPARDADPIVALIPTAVRVDIPGHDLMPFGGEVDPLLSEVFRFVAGEHRAPDPERQLAAILYTDLVDSTRLTASVGDLTWRRIVERHDEVVRSCVARRGGTVIKMTGDGVLAILSSADAAIRAAQEILNALAANDLEVRAGIHVGDIERRGADIAGLAVAIASRVVALATSGQVLVSSTVVQAATGGAHQFGRLGVHELKGVSGGWDLFEVLSD